MYFQIQFKLYCTWHVVEKAIEKKICLIVSEKMSKKKNLFGQQKKKNGKFFFKKTQFLEYNYVEAKPKKKR